MIIDKIEAIDAITNCINMPLINFEGSIHRLFLNRFISEIEMLLLGKKPIINGIKRKGLPDDKAQIKIKAQLKSRNEYIKEKIPNIMINIQINNTAVAVKFSLLS